MDEPEEQVDQASVESPADDLTDDPADDPVEPDLAEVEEAWVDEAPAPAADDEHPSADESPETTDDEPWTDDDASSEDLEVEPEADEQADLEPEPLPEPESDDPDETPAAPPVEPTGHASVDAVLASLEGLEHRSVHEHVGVFEEAHAALRRALDETDQQG